MFKNKGTQLALITAIISGFSVFINKFAVASFSNPVMLPTIKNSLVGLMLLAVLFASGKLKGIKKLTRKELLQLLAVGIVGGFLPFYLFFTGLSKVPAVNAAIIHKSLVLWVAVLAIPLLKERISKLLGLAIFLLFAGNLMIGGFKGFRYSEGEFMILTATLLWALETILVKKLVTSFDPTLLAFTRMGLGSLFLLLTSLITAPADFIKAGNLTTTQIFWIVLTAFTLFGYVTSWYKALKYASAIYVSAVLVLAALITNVLSAIFISHTWNLLLTFQGLTIFIGTVFALKGVPCNKPNESTARQLY